MPKIVNYELVMSMKISETDKNKIERIKQREFEKDGKKRSNSEIIRMALAAFDDDKNGE